MLCKVSILVTLYLEFVLQNKKNSKYKYFQNTICKIVSKKIASIILELEL